MIDIHSHVLPGMDDGSKSIEESLHMLEASKGQGIGILAATPHFYPSQNSPEQFLERRDKAAERLQRVWRTELPQLKLGTEVYYFEGISRAPKIEALAIERTGLLLVEMPFSPWTERMVREVRELHSQGRVKVLLAHIERYRKFVKPGMWEQLREAGVLMQSNAEFFLDWRTRRRALRMLKDGQIDLLGSDCHGMDLRPPQLGKALEVIGDQGRRRLHENIRRLVPEADNIRKAVPEREE